MSLPPQKFWRVQRITSFITKDKDGLWARGFYHMDPCHWISQSKVRRHLIWEDKSPEPTPFISVFDSLEDVTTFIEKLGWKPGTYDVLEIHAASLRYKSITIRRLEKPNVQLRVAETPETGTVFLKMTDIATVLDVKPVHQSEWLAVNHIPSSMYRICYLEFLYEQ